MRNLLGGKGANLAEMTNAGLPVPPGFTITTEASVNYFDAGKRFPEGLWEQVQKALIVIEKQTGKKFGDSANPLLVSCRSGARVSMPGMMDTVLNIGLNPNTLKGFAALMKNDRVAWDAYRRLIQMFSNIVKGIERHRFEEVLDKYKARTEGGTDTDLTVSMLQEIATEFKRIYEKALREPFPDDPLDQLKQAIGAVFESWYGAPATAYRKAEGLPDDWGTAVNVQTMVFGNMGETSGTGVAFTRNPATGENEVWGEYLLNAQGEDVVAGIRTPAPINEYSQSEHNKNLPTLEKEMPKIYNQLVDIRNRLEKHYHDMQDIEFTIENGRLFMLQTRVGKRNGPAAVRMAYEMYSKKLITAQEAVKRVTPIQLDELLHPVINPMEEKLHNPLAKGLPAGPGGASGQIVFSASDAVQWVGQGKSVILVREETNPEDVEGMRAAVAILTARGGMTSHAALVARGWGKCCIVGCSPLDINYEEKQLSVDNKILKQGDWITLNGSKGLVYEGRLPMMSVSEENKILNDYLKLCDRIRSLKIRTNADTPEDAQRARAFGAEGIGLFRTEHMFYGKGSEKPLFYLRKMIISNNADERRKALDELFPYVKNDIKKTLEVMEGLPVTIRLIDPPLHEFVPQNPHQREELARSLYISTERLNQRADTLREANPMMGHRGVRLGVTYPEISEMQIRAIFEAAAELINQGKRTKPEIMIPVVSEVKELQAQLIITKRVYREVLEKYKLKNIPYSFGTMIEIPRACLLANELARVAEFFSFGTNDLTQMGFGFSRDDLGGFLPDYLKNGVLDNDPFVTIDQSGIGQLIEMGIKRGRKERVNLKVGICGEHGGEPRSIEFCHRMKMNYVSCSPFRIPIARLAAAQAALKVG